MRILFVWRKYNQVVGGVERMSIALMNEMVKRGHDVGLLSWDRHDARTYYEMDDRIEWFKLNAGNPDEKASMAMRFERMRKIRSVVKNYNPDTIIAFMDGVFLSVKLSILGLHIPTIEAERCSAARFEYLKSGKYVNLIFQSLRLAKNITIQLESYRNDYPEYLRSRIVSIPNPVFQPQRHAKPGQGAEKILLSVGRLSYQKNYGVLIDAFAKIATEFPDWTLKIVGEGEEKEQLEKRAENLRISGQVQFANTVKNVSDLYCSSHLFILPSRWEGFPNALAEALAHGLPSVGFRECLGVRDLIHDGINGILADKIDNADTLAAALRTLMKDDKRREEMGIAASNSMKPYAPEAVFDQWENFFKKAVA
jgi:glycosyltransferase involved in cell wall biosynthesis